MAQGPGEGSRPQPPPPGRLASPASWSTSHASSASGVPTELSSARASRDSRLLALLLEFVVAPRIGAREDLRLWHSLGSALFALQWVCAGVVLWRQGASQLSPADAS